MARVVVEQFILRWGAPRSIHTDQRKNFDSALFRAICELLDIHKTRTTPYHPQSDGFVERLNRTITTMLSMFVDANQGNWDDLLSYVMMAYRSSVQATTKFSPYFAVFGREIVMPADLMFNVEVIKPYKSVGGYVDELEGRLRSVHSAIHKHQESASRSQKHFYDLKIRGPKYEVGDRVWVQDKARKKGRCPKFQRHYKGPYIIREQLSEQLFRLSGQGRPGFVVHYNRLKPCTRSFSAGKRLEGEGQPSEGRGGGLDSRCPPAQTDVGIPATWWVMQRPRVQEGPLVSAGPERPTGGVGLVQSQRLEQVMRSSAILREPSGAGQQVSGA